MWLLGLSLLVLVLKVLDVAPIAAWSWWYVVAPFAFTVLWFEFGEAFFGFDRKRLRKLDYENAREERLKNTYNRMTRNKKKRHS